MTAPAVPDTVLDEQTVQQLRPACEVVKIATSLSLVISTFRCDDPARWADLIVFACGASLTVLSCTHHHGELLNSRTPVRHGRGDYEPYSVVSSDELR